MTTRLNINQQGSVLMLTLVFTSIFTLSALGMAGWINYQHRLARQKVSWHNALQIAEAGINYYRWHLAHAPGDYTDGTGQPGPYLHDYLDPQGETMGRFSLEITTPTACSSSVIIKSTGWTLVEPHTTRVISMRYGQESLSSYAFITNSNVWFGEQESLHGEVHSNGGIRMDGAADSRMTSAKETYLCGPEHGCSSQEKPGIWGSGTTQSLWEFPVSNVDFDALTVDLATLKDVAETSGVYLPNLGLGYHLIFKSNGTFDVYRVTKLYNPIWGYDMDGWIKLSLDIQNESFLANYPLSGECNIIFVEDNVWVDGVVNGRVTLAAAKLPAVPNNNRRIVINGNLTYLAKNGTHVLGLIAQKDILVPYSSAPDNLEINAAMIAQKGRIFRLYYPGDLLNTITTYGSIITNNTWTWTWVNQFDIPISGYEHTETLYDPYLKYNPPPYFPTKETYSFLRWEEVTEKQ